MTLYIPPPPSQSIPVVHSYVLHTKTVNIVASNSDSTTSTVRYLTLVLYTVNVLNLVQ